ncbi:ribosomal protein P1 [Trichuris trichiura]|uniref:Large ribosomal subunit protein P1 n=1 Tax=Trichuris trichiura TaxID=36087 RepID=A0A077Z107_TRITR|nr:ribosomal protein P1 [Trichuris trichiura]
MLTCLVNLPCCQKMALNNEMACAYAALILADDGIKVSVDGIKSILTAADVHVDSVWPEIFVNALESVNISELVTNIGGGFGAGSVAAAPAAAEVQAESAKAPEKKEEKKEESESDEELGLDLFG